MLSVCSLLAVYSGFSIYSSWHEDPTGTGTLQQLLDPGRCGPCQQVREVGGHSSTSGPSGPMVAAGRAARWLRCPHLGQCPHAGGILGDPQPGRVLCGLSQAQLGHGSGRWAAQGRVLMAGLGPPLCGTTFWGEAHMGAWPICLRFPTSLPWSFAPYQPCRRKNASCWRSAAAVWPLPSSEGGEQEALPAETGPR